MTRQRPLRKLQHALSRTSWSVLGQDLAAPEQTCAAPEQTYGTRVPMIVAALQTLGVNQIARHRRHSCPAIVCPGHTPAIFVGHSSSPSEPDEAEARLGPAAPCGNDLQGAAAQRSSTLCAEGALKIAGAPVARWLAAPELSTGLELLPPHWGWQYLESMRTADVITRSIDRDGNFALPVEGGGRGNGNGKSREERGNGTVFTTTARATWQKSRSY